MTVWESLGIVVCVIMGLIMVAPFVTYVMVSGGVREIGYRVGVEYIDCMGILFSKWPRQSTMVLIVFALLSFLLPYVIYMVMVWLVVSGWLVGRAIRGITS
jgi:hypothetical protein